MRVRYIGGTGEISYGCIHNSVWLGHNMHVYNRGGPWNQTLPRQVTFHTGDEGDGNQGPGTISFTRVIVGDTAHAAR